MDTAAETLLIVVSSALTVFLIVFTIALMYVIRLLKKADEVAGSVESAATAVKQSAKAMPFVSLITNIVKLARRKR
ncbi:MAG TPA: hypothetical protein VFB03_03040 [Candidatus Saccharimonadales bacterium]|nr:hypothetical protein [Candidatus Saccharimonadales bacterium]